MEEMKGCRAVQCLLVKKDDWEPEIDDQDFERDSKVFLTGLGDGSPDMSSISFLPQRHVSTMLTAIVCISGIPASNPRLVVC